MQLATVPPPPLLTGRRRRVIARSSNTTGQSTGPTINALLASRPLVKGASRIEPPTLFQPLSDRHAVRAILRRGVRTGTSGPAIGCAQRLVVFASALAACVARVHARALTLGRLILEPAWLRPSGGVCIFLDARVSERESGGGVGGRVPRGPGERGGPGVPPADRALGWSGTNHAAADRPPRAGGPTADVSIPGLVSRILTSRAWRSSGRRRSR